MSYDLAIWEGEQSADNDEATSIYEELCERYGESEDASLPPTARIKAYVETLLERYPGDVHDNPWASTPVIEEAAGPIAYLLMARSRAEEVSACAAQLAHENGLVCYDPQSGTLLSGLNRSC